MPRKKPSDSPEIVNTRVSVQMPEALFLELKKYLDAEEMNISQFFRKSVRSYLAEKNGK